MEIKIEEQAPDGVNLNINNLILDTDEQVFKVISMIRRISKNHKISAEESMKFFEKCCNEDNDKSQVDIFSKDEIIEALRITEEETPDWNEGFQQKKKRFLENLKNVNQYGDE